MSNIDLYHGNCLDVMKRLSAGSVQTCITSPPYFGLRDYGVDGQLGNEATPAAYVGNMVAVFREVWRLLADTGTLWLNLGDSYNGSGKGGVFSEASAKQATNNGANIAQPLRLKELPPKSLFGIPWRVAFALQDDGWILRSDIIWHKPNPMPESVTDRCTRAHEYIFMFVKQGEYYYNADAIKEPSKEYTGQAGTFARSGPVSEHVIPGQTAAQNRPNRTDKQRGHSRRHAGFNGRWDAMTKEEQGSKGRNKRDVWTVAPSQFEEAHFATFPPALIEPCVLAGSAPGDVVLDPFNGSGTTGIVALRHKRHYVGIELNESYFDMSMRRLSAAEREANNLPKQLTGTPSDYSALPMFAMEGA